MFLNPMLYKPGYSSSEAPANRVILYLLEDVGVEEVRAQKNYKHCQFFHQTHLFHLNTFKKVEPLTFLFILQ